ncbi:hypothetical protein ACFORL_00265 [Legionella dresdenensis]|uniref:Transmembrane protein n=1 Tax=Legionella dresdenensis TaxID=450200 RepID=A0ABV8CC48_9GAMM
MPHLIWNWHYDVPEFVSHWRERLVENHNMTRTSANWTIFFSFFIPAVVSGLIAYFTSNRLDNDIYGLTPEKNPEEEGLIVEDIKETASFGSKLFLLIIAVVAFVFFVEWLIAVPPPQ